MASRNKTRYLQLNDWEGSDVPKRTDFNDDNKKIDEFAGSIAQEVENINREKATKADINRLERDKASKYELEQVKDEIENIDIPEVDFTSVNKKIDELDRNKADKIHTHMWRDIVDKPSRFTPSTHSHNWSSITNKPTEFKPEEHKHTWGQITYKPTEFTPKAHTHQSSDIIISGSKRLNQYVTETDKKINDLFQSGDKANKALVSGLISKGVQASTNDTITTNANKVKNIHIPKYDVGDRLNPQQFEILKAKEGSWDSGVLTDGSTYDYYNGHYASISDSKVSYFNLKTGQGWKINFKRNFSSEYILQNIITVSDRNIFVVTEKFDNTRESKVIKLDFKGEVVDFNVADVAYGGYDVANIRSLRNGNGFVTAHYLDDDIRLRFYSNYGLLRKQVVWEDVDYGRYRGYVKTIVPLNNDEYAIVRSIENSGTGLEDSTVVLFVFDKDGNQKSRQGVSITSAALKDSGLDKPMYVFDLINEDGTQYGDYIYFYNGRGGGGWQSWGGGCFRMKISSANIDTFDNEHVGGGANKVTKLNNGNFVHFESEKIIERDANTLKVVSIYTKEIHKSFGVVAEDGVYKLANSYYYGRIPYITGVRLK